MSRFNVEKIVQVSMTYNPEKQVVEWCAIEAPNGVVHWLTEEEHADVFAKVKARSKGVFATRQDKELQEAKEEAARLRGTLEELSKTLRA